MPKLSRSLLLALAPLALAACQPSNDPVAVTTDRALAASFAETPFVNGPMSVLATEDGQLSTWRFTPCRGGGAICAGGLQGPAGTLTATPDYHVIQGLHGRTFWLAPGGSGWVQYPGGAMVPLAWDAVDHPAGDWEEARLTEGWPRE